MEEKNKYQSLPTIRTLEGLMLMIAVLKEGTLNINIPVISDENYIEMVKMAVDGVLE